MKIFKIAFTIIAIFINTLIVKAQNIDLDNPLTGEHDSPTVNAIIGIIIKVILGLVGSLALLMFVYGGFTFMLAAGASDKIQKGKDILLWSTVGLIVIFTAYAVLFFVLQVFDNLG